MDVLPSPPAIGFTGEYADYRINAFDDLMEAEEMIEKTRVKVNTMMNM